MTYLESANLATLAEEAATRLGERRGLVFEGRSYTNWELLDQARRLHIDPPHDLAGGNDQSDVEIVVACIVVELIEGRCACRLEGADALVRPRLALGKPPVQFRWILKRVVGRSGQRSVG